MNGQYTQNGHCYAIRTTKGKFAAMAMWENGTHIEFQSKRGSKTILNKSLILELYDLGLPKPQVVI